MALNLVRNSRVFFTTNLAAAATSSTVANAVNAASHTAATTLEIQVLDGFSFSQNTNTETVSINEAGATPNRGSRTFNTSLAPVDFSFSTYIRPRLTNTTGTGTVQSEEKVLWNALLNGVAQDDAITSTLGTVTGMTRATTLSPTVTIVGTGFSPTIVPVGEVITLGGLTGAYASEWNSPIRVDSYNSTTNIIGTYLWAPSTAAGTTPSVTASSLRFTRSAYVPFPTTAGDTQNGTHPYSLIHTGRNATNTLLPFGMIVSIDDATYLLDNCALNSAQIDFSLDGIATIQWSGNASALRSTSRTTLVDGAPTVALSGAVTGVANLKVTSANYITNKLSTISLIKNIAGVGAGNTTFTLALTGGSINISNNINYITPANLGVVNTPITYFTGNLSVSGSINAYLHSGTTPTNNTGVLLADLLNSASGSAGVEPKFRMQVNIGGGTTTNVNGTRVELRADGAMLSIPSIETQQIMSTTINFNAQPFNSAVNETTANGGNSYDISNSNQLLVRYLSL